MFNFFRKSPKPPRQYVVQDVEVEDLAASISLQDSSSLKKHFLGRARYDPNCSDRDDGIVIISAEFTLGVFMRDWHCGAVMLIDDRLVPFTNFSGATVVRTKRIVQVKRPEMPS